MHFDLMLKNDKNYKIYEQRNNIIQIHVIFPIFLKHYILIIIYVILHIVII